MTIRILPSQLLLFEDWPLNEANVENVDRMRRRWRVLRLDCSGLVDEADLPLAWRGWGYDETERWLLRCVLAGLPPKEVVSRLGKTPRRVQQILSALVLRTRASQDLDPRHALMVRALELRQEEISRRSVRPA